jgi:signal transduction histidine kinase/CheY-like chemotaxis protein
MRLEKTRSELVNAIPVDLSILGDSSVVAGVVVDRKGRVLEANTRFLALLETRDAVGKPFGAWISDAGERATWEQALATGAHGVTLRLTAANGRPVVLRGDLRAAGDRESRRWVGVFIDVDEQEQVRTLLQRGARMEALGSLTAGIAHDFNNLLTVLVGNLYLLAEEVRGHAKLFEKVKAARDAGKRGADLIRQLLAFARREELPTEIVKVDTVIAGLTPLLGRALGKRIALETAVDAGLGSVRASAAQLESAIVNLAVNARDAIARRGTVRIAARRMDLAGDEAARRRLAQGRYIALHVVDDGSGMRPETLLHVFEPFFSTKREQGGTGLGLSMVRWFAEQAGGSVEIESAVERGTTVTLWLPVARQAAPEVLDSTMPLSTLPTGTEKLIIVGAEDGLRATIEQILEVLGYGVRFLAATDEVAVAVRLERSDLLLLDSSGLDDDQQTQAIGAARGAKPSIPIVLLTDARAGRRVASGVVTLIKPFSLADLAGAIRAALDAPHPI